MPFPWLQASKDAKAENRRDGSKPRTDQANPAALQRRPQIFGEQCRRAKRHYIQFARQSELPPPFIFLPSQIQIGPCANKPEEKGRTRQPKVPRSEEPQLIRSVIEIERPAVPIRQQRSAMRRVPADRGEPARRCQRQRQFPPARQFRSDLGVSNRANEPEKADRV